MTVVSGTDQYCYARFSLCMFRIPRDDGNSHWPIGDLAVYPAKGNSGHPDITRDLRAGLATVD